MSALGYEKSFVSKAYHNIQTYLPFVDCSQSSIVPRLTGEGAVDTHARWQPVTQGARSRWSYGKIEDCEQSINLEQINVENISVSIRS